LLWRKNVAFVTQDTFLFHDSIEANLRLVNPNVTRDQMMEVIRLAQAEDIIEKLPQGLATIIGDSGVRLSGGEQQRLALARDILSKTDILILDEVTSFLDANNFDRILAVLTKLKEIMTIVFISHQSVVAEHADYVFLLENGRLKNTLSEIQLSCTTTMPLD
jgi:ABC-type multidrug transport system fused ATPase/permease subunit